jgi:hypothetical protein
LDLPGEQDTHLNTSYHSPLTIELKVPTPDKSKARKREKNEATLKFKRKETDVEAFKRSIDCEIELLNPDNLDVETAVMTFQSMIKTAMIESTPYRKVHDRRTTSKKAVAWTDDLAEAVRHSKMANFLWKESGRPRGDHPTWKDRKAANKRVRSVQRRQHAENRYNLLQQIDSAAENDNQLLHRLVKSRRTDSASTNTLIVDGHTITDETEIRDVWADYYEDLATPEDTDTNSHQQVTDLIRMISQWDDQKVAVTEDLLDDAIKELSKNKAPDIEGLYAEQLQMLTPKARSTLLMIINKIIQLRSIPNCLKRAYKLPIPKKGKDSRYRDNYRGITVAPIILKVLELVCLKHELQETIDSRVNHLQFGFSSGKSPSMASLLITEAVNDASINKKSLYIASLDAWKAFDVVDQQLLLRKLHEAGTSTSMWKMIDSMYQDSEEVIKWNGKTSRPYTTQLGVKQGGILSPALYKIYINDLLETLQRSALGTSIGTTFIGSPTCADDILLLSNDPHELQAMLNVAYEYSNIHAYQIHPQKSVITTLVERRTDKPLLGEDRKWYMGSNEVTITDTFIHLGLQWSKDKKAPDIAQNIQNARRMSYLLMRIGLHGVDGLGPATSLKLIKTYITPRLLHGLEAASLSHKDQTSLETYYRKLLRQIQGLPDGTANEAVYLLLGATPITATFHIKVLTLFGNICRLELTHPLHHLCIRQLAVNNNKSSWTAQLLEIGNKYGIDIHQQILVPWPKPLWKRHIKTVVTEFTHEELVKNAAGKSSLKWLITSSHRQTHPVWQFSGGNTRSLDSANIRARMLVGRYKTQSLLAKYSPDRSAVCHLCNTEEEDTLHMVALCPRTSHIRDQALQNLTQVYTQENLPVPENPAEICFALLNGDFKKDNRTVTTKNHAKADQISNKFCSRLDSFRNSYNLQDTMITPTEEVRLE